MFSSIWNSIKRNHFAHMAICCALPIVLIVALQALGMNGFWLLAIGLAACVGSHLVMAYVGSKNEEPKGEKPCH